MKYLKSIKILIVTLIVMLSLGCDNDDAPKGDLAPRATFTASTVFVTAGSEITFTDSSTNVPTTWSWEMPGATPSTSTEQNPTVVYETEGVYSVTLTITNQYGSDTVVFENYITISSAEIPSVVKFDFDSNLTNEGTVAIDATTSGTPAYGTGHDGGGSYLFNGADNQLKIVGYKGINGTNPRTMSVWIKPDVTSYDSGIMSWGVSATGSRWSFKYRTNGGLRIEWQGGGMNSTGTNLGDGAWHHVAVTFDGTNLVTIYIDGMPDNSTTSSIINTSSAGEIDVEIGTYRDGFLYKGELDDLRIYDLALNVEEIADLAQN